MATPVLTPRTLQWTAKRRLAVSSVVPVASGYEHSLRPGEARFSLVESTICSDSDR